MVAMGSDRHLKRSELLRWPKLLDDAECDGGGGVAWGAAPPLMKGWGNGNGGLLPGRLFGEK